MAKLVTTYLRTFTIEGEGETEKKTLKSEFTKAKNKEVKDQLLFRQKLSFINQCKDLTKNEAAEYPEMELEMLINDKHFYKARFRKGEMVYEDAAPLTVV